MVEVVAALIRRGQQFLICQRPADKKRALLWEFPGGKIEEGESPQQALIRECREELGVTLAVGSLYAQAVHRYPDIHIRLSLYEAAIAKGDLERREHNDLRWIEAAQIPSFTFCPADVDILAQIMRNG